MATINVSIPTSLLPAAKASGRCPPSLISDEQIIEGGAFEMAMLRALDGMTQGLILSSEENAAENFTSAIKMASGSSASRIREQRRCLLLAAIGSTAEHMPSNPTLKNLLNAGVLVTIKAWLDDILAGKVGGIDLLLHLLNNIIPLPVSKAMVTSSRLGKTVSSVEKHDLCVGGANESAIKSRIQQVKECWSASVKALKNSTNNNVSTNASTKRPIDEAAPTTAKKAKNEGSSLKKAKHESSSLSSLLKKVDKTNNVVSSSTVTAAETARLKALERDAKLKERLAAANGKSAELKENTDARPKKDDRRIHWADSDGQVLAVSDGKNADTAKKAGSEKTRQSRWADRKKKDIQHEKELLLQSRKVGSVDHDKDDSLNAMAMMAIWKPPQPLPPDKANPPIQVTSNEIRAQTNRIGTTPAVRYSSENEIPISPTLLSEVEKALELSSRITSTPSVIPFFTPQAATVPTVNGSFPSIAPSYPPQAQPSMYSSSEATLETVLMMGLPFFLVGSNVQALQMLAANPGLLASFKDVTGVFKQPELINLVQTLTQNVAPQASHQSMQMTTGYNDVGAVQPNQGYYQPPPSSASFAQPPPAQHPAGRGYRGDQNVGDANLHLSGYGPATSNEEIKAMFAPYVHVTEIVNKSGFSFINTNDPDGAHRAREALNGSLLGGLPCRINSATRKARNPNFPGGGTGAPVIPAPGGLESLPRNSLGQVDFTQVRDDRGNPATKNLFVAGYGAGTTEQQLKDLFGQHATVISIIMKGTFSFVNTTDKDAAVIARSSLGGSQLNGGAMRINFAKETGRLGTSFDSTYGPAGASASTYGRY